MQRDVVRDLTRLGIGGVNSPELDQHADGAAIVLQVLVPVEEVVQDVNRFLRGLRLTAEAESGAPITFGDKQVGTIGSTCVSPAHGPIALALVRREAAPGDTVHVGDERIEAEVIDLPFEQTAP